MKTIFTIIAVAVTTFIQAQTAPIFTGGTKQNISICKNTNNIIIDNKMIVQDPDAAQTITYTIATAPINGTVHGFPQSISTGTGGLVVPTGFNYQPTNNYFGLDSFIVSITDGTYTAQTKIIVTINNLPIVAAITGNTIVCIGSTGTQLLNTTLAGMWSSSNTAIATINNTGFVTPISQGNTNIIYKVTNLTTGCSDSAMATLQVNNIPILQPITGATRVCQKNTTQLANSTIGGIWQSIDTNIAKISNTGLVAGLMPGTTTIKYTYTNAAGCSNTITTNFSVDSLPTLSPILANKTTMCIGGSQIHLRNTNSTGIWHSNNLTIATVDNYGNIYGQSVGITSITYTVVIANGCRDSSAIDIKVAAAATAPPIIGPTKVCVGSAIVLTDSLAGGIWSISSLYNNATISSTGIVTGTVSGFADVYYTVYNALGCDITVRSHIGIYSLPTISKIVGNNQVCIGTSTLLTNATTGGVWSSSNTAIATVVSTTGVVLGIAAGIDTIKYTLTNANGCTSVVIFPITITAHYNVPSIIGSSSVCINATIKLSNQLTGGTWASSTNTIATIIGDTVYGASVGVAVISYTYGTGTCKGTTYKNIVVNPAPAIGIITGAAPICMGSVATYTNNLAGGVWSVNDNSIAVIDANGLLKPLKNATITIKYEITNSSGCYTYRTKDVIINALPVINPIKGDNRVCMGNTKMFSIFPSNVVGVWSSSNNSIATIDSTYSDITYFKTFAKIRGISSGLDTIYYTVSSNGCSTTIFKTIYVDSSLKLPPIVGPSDVCLYEPINRYYSNAIPGGVWSVISDSGKYLMSVSNDTFQRSINLGRIYTNYNNDTGNVIVKYTFKNGVGCADSVFKNVVIHDSLAKPVVTGKNTLCVMDTTTLIGTPSGGIFMHSYYGNFVALDTITGFLKALNPTTTTSKATISYKMTNSFGCTSFAYNFLITINPGPAIAAAAPANANLCVGDTITFTNSKAGGKWYLIDKGRITDSTEYGVIDSNTGLYRAKGTTGMSNSGFSGGVDYNTQDVIYLLKNASGCGSQSISYVRSSSPPQIDSTVGINSVCLGVKTTLYNASKSGRNGSSVSWNGTWSSSNLGIATVNINGHIGSVVVTPVAPGNCNIYYTCQSINAACEAKYITPFTVSVIPPLAPIVAPLGINGVCVGDSIQLTNATMGGNWFSSDTSKATVNNVGKVKGKAAGTMTIGYSVGSGGCSAGAFSSGVVYNLPQVTAIAGNETLCVGSSITLINDSLGGVWKSSDTTIATVDVVGKVTGKLAGAVIITYTKNNTTGCIKGVEKNITVVALPTINNIVGNTSICKGSKTTMFSSTPNGVWASVDTNIATINNVSGLLTGVSVGTTNIKYVVTNTAGCKDSISTPIKINKLPPIAPITGNSFVCMGAKTTLSNAANLGVWASNNNNIATINNNGVVTGITANTVDIKYVVTDTVGCKDSVSVFFTVNPLPVVDVITGNNPICVGTTNTLYNVTNGGVWSSKNPIIATINSVGVVNGIAAGITNIKYMATNYNGCIDSSVITVTINLKPIIIATSNSPVPAGQTIQLNATSTDAIATWNWSGVNGFTSIIQNPIINNATSAMMGVYKVVGTSNLGCKSDTTTTNVIVGDSYTIYGKVINPLKKVINNAIVKLTGTAINTYQTDINGYYNCLNLQNGGYIIKPYKNNDITKANGVKSVDVILVQRHILNQNKLNSAYKIIAADVNGDKNINSVDVIRMKRLILGSDTTFTKGTGINKIDRLWEFVDSSYVFADTTNPFPFKDSISFTNLTSNKTNQTFVGVKLGDVNYDWDATIAKSTTVNSLQLTVTEKEIIVNEKQVSIPFKINNFNNINAMQYTLHFDNTKYEFVGIKNNYLNIDYNIAQANQTGNIAMLWTDKNAQPKTLEDGTELFTLILRPLSSIYNQPLIDFTINNSITDIEAWDNDFNSHNIILTKQETINQKPETINELFSVSPNPTNGTVNIQVSSSNNKTMQIILTDMYGKIILTENIKVSTGVNNFNLNLQKNNKLASGVYSLKTIGLESDVVKQVVIIKQ